MNAVVVRTCAKVNLCLRVLGRRPDGYHDVQTIMQAVAVWDFLRIAESGDERVALRVVGGVAPDDDTNLCWRAASTFGERTGRGSGRGRPRPTATCGGVMIELTKSVPVRAGLGGGSSDAAATLAGMARLRGLELDQGELEGMAAEIGADVPFFLRGGCCLAQGRGERLEAVPGVPMWLVLVVPEARMATADAYAGLHRPASSGDGHPLSDEVRQMVEALRRGDPVAVAGALHNDFAALEAPELAETQAATKALVARGCLGAAMSGSGTAAFGIAASRQAAERIADELRAFRLPSGQARWEWVQVARTLGPGEGMVISELTEGRDPPLRSG